MSRINLVATMKDEGPFIIEWLSHHLAVGFDQIGVATNDCTDGTDLLLSRLADAGYCQHFDHIPDPDMAVAHSAYSLLYAQDVVQNADWIMVIDSDEFVNIHIGDGHISELIERYQDVDIIALNWKAYGAYEKEPWNAHIWTKHGFQAADNDARTGSGGVKSITKNPTRFERLNCHCPGRPLKKEPLIYANMAGTRFHINNELPREHLRHFPKDKVAHQDAQLNHYMTRNLQAFLLRRARGASYSKNIRYNYPFFKRYGLRADEEDQTILRYDARALEIQEAILKTPGIADLHNMIVDHYNQKLEMIEAVIMEHAAGFPDNFEDIVVTVERNLENFKFTLAPIEKPR